MNVLDEHLVSAHGHGATVKQDNQRIGAATEHRLLVAAKQGDGASFAELLRRCDRAVRATAWRLVGDPHVVDDVLQDAYLKAFKSLDRFDPSGAATFGSWLHHIVHSVAIDHHRRVARRPRSAGRYADQQRGHVSPTNESVVAQRAALRTAFAELDSRHAAAVALVDGEGFSQAEAARFLGVGTSTMSRHLNDGRTQLRLLLEQAGVMQ